MELEINAIFPWLRIPWRQLINQYRLNRLSHAILVTGKRGVGKFKLAEDFSKLLLCASASQQACEKCQSCGWVRAGTHPDKFIIMPEEKDRFIRIDQIRQLSAALSRKAQCHQGYQVVIIHPADKMNLTAMNALLKTLEEPQGSVCLLLITAMPERLPATIRSRCQQIHIHPTKQQVVEWLESQLNRKQEVDLLLAVSNGAPLRALEYATTHYLASRKLWFDRWLQLLRAEITPIMLANEWLKFDINDLLLWQLSVMMDLIRLQHGVSVKFLTHRDQLSLLQSITMTVTLPVLFQLFDEFISAYQAANSPFNLNHQLLLEKLLIMTSNVINLTS